jgi:hypothetical protein
MLFPITRPWCGHAAVVGAAENANRQLSSLQALEIPSRYWLIVSDERGEVQNWSTKTS